MRNSDRVQHPLPLKLAQNILTVIFISLVVLIILNSDNPLTTRLERDSGIFIYVSSYLLKGKTLYKYAWENKAPVLFFIDALGLWIGKGSRWGIWIMELVFLLGAAVTGFYTLRKHFDFGSAALSSLIWLLGLNLALTGSGGNFSEEYSLFFSFASLFLFMLSINKSSTIWLHLLLGISLGTNFLIRSNNIGVQVSIILTLMVLAFARKTKLNLIKSLVVTSLGFLIPVALVFSYFIIRNSVPTFLEASFLYNFYYSKGHSDLVGSFLSGIATLGFSAGIALVGIGVAAANLRHQIKDKDINPLSLWICIDFPIEVVLSGLSGRTYQHYFISWLPLIAFSTAYLIQYTFPNFTQWSQRAAVLFLSILIAVIIITQSSTFSVYWKSFSQLMQNRSQIQKIDLVAEYVHANTLPNETVLIWGGQYGINFLAHRDTPSPYLLYPLYVPSEITNRITSEYYQTVISNPPVLIADGSYYVPEEIVPLSSKNPTKWLIEHNAYDVPYLEKFFQFFHQNYSYVAKVDGVAIYRLNH